MTTATQIRSEIAKALNIKPSLLGARWHKYSMGQTLHVTVKSADISLNAVDRIVDCYRTPRSTFVQVDYSHELISAYTECETPSLILSEAIDALRAHPAFCSRGYAYNAVYQRDAINAWANANADRFNVAYEFAARVVTISKLEENIEREVA